MMGDTTEEHEMAAKLLRLRLKAIQEQQQQQQLQEQRPRASYNTVPSASRHLQMPQPAQADAPWRMPNRDVHVNSLTRQLESLRQKQDDLSRELRELRHSRDLCESLRPNDSYTEPTSHVSQAIIQSLQQQQELLLQLVQDRNPLNTARPQPARMQPMTIPPPAGYPVHGQYGGAGCQHCHGRAPAPYMMPAPVFMMPQQGYVPSSTKSSGRREAPRRGRPSLYPRPETSFPGSNSPPLETPGPIPEEFLPTPEDSRPQSRQPNPAAAQKFRKAIHGALGMVRWRKYAEWVQEWRRKQVETLQQKIHRALPSARHFLFQKGAPLRQALKAILKKESAQLKLAYKNTFQLKFPPPDVRVALNETSAALDGIVKAVCELKPTSPGLSQRVPHCVTALLTEKQTVYPDDYLWPVEKVKLKITPFNVLKAVEPGGGEVMFLGMIFGRALLTTGLLVPVDCGLVDVLEEGRIVENVQVIVTLLYYVLRLAFASLTKPHSTLGFSIDPVAVDPKLMEEFPLLRPEEEVKIYLKKHDKLLNTLQQQLVSWAKAFLAEAKAARSGTNPEL